MSLPIAGEAFIMRARCSRVARCCLPATTPRFSARNYEVQSMRAVNRSFIIRYLHHCSKYIDDKHVENIVKLRTKRWVEKWVIAFGLCPWAAAVMVENKVRYVVLGQKVENIVDRLTVKRKVLTEARALRDAAVIRPVGFKDEPPASDATVDGISPHIIEDNKNCIYSIKQAHQSNYDSDMSSRIINNSIHSGNCEDRHADTTLVILPGLGNNFDLFLSLCDAVEAALHKEGLDNFVQVATFHPQYQFGDSSSRSNLMTTTSTTSNCGVVAIDQNNGNKGSSCVEDVSDFTNRSPYPILHLLRVSPVVLLVCVGSRSSCRTSRVS